MSDLKHIPTQSEATIPWWQDGKTTSETLKEPHFLSKGVNQFWDLFKAYLLFPLQQADALVCSEPLLNLLAWDRDITRFTGEPLSLFRKRVKYAVLNAQDAGSVAGFIAIFARLGIEIITFKEREDPIEWDICTIEISDSDISQNSALVKTLIEQYGRTCRRYRFEVLYVASVNMSVGTFPHRFQLIEASLPVSI